MVLIVDVFKNGFKGLKGFNALLLKNLLKSFVYIFFRNFRFFFNLILNAENIFFEWFSLFGFVCHE